MFHLTNLVASHAEYEEVGLFDQMILNLQKLRQEVFHLYDAENFECDSDTFYELIYHIGITQQQLTDPDITIDEDFFVSIGEMLLMIQEDFEKLVNHKSIMQTALKAIRDKGRNVIDGTDIVKVVSQEEVSRARHTIFRLTSEIKRINASTPRDTTRQEAQLYQFPPTTSKDPEETSIPDQASTDPVMRKNPQNDNVTHIDPIKKRTKIIQDLIFNQDGKLLPDVVVREKREKIKKTLSPDIVPAFNWDCHAANDEKFPDHELPNEIILTAIKQAKLRKDGAFIQSIKNNLLRNAANDETFDPGLETSNLLADHIKNLSEANPITLQTLEYGKLVIKQSKTVEYGDATYYKADVIFENGNKKSLLISANASVVGDLSDKIIGEYDQNNKLHIQNKPCTIRYIRSRIISKELHKKGFLSNIGNTVHEGFQKLKNRFSFGKK